MVDGGVSYRSRRSSTSVHLQAGVERVRPVKNSEKTKEVSIAEMDEGGRTLQKGKTEVGRGKAEAERGERKMDRGSRSLLVVAWKGIDVNSTCIGRERTKR
jgi:hypothetical protein